MKTFTTFTSTQQYVLTYNIRPANACQFSGCRNLRAKTVEWERLRFDLCSTHANRLSDRPGATGH